MSKGLHQEIAEFRTGIARDWVTAKSIHADPRDAHEAEVRVQHYQRKLEVACRAAHVGEAQAENIAEVIGKLKESDRRSDELTLAIRDLESAGFRLRQHLGEQP